MFSVVFRDIIENILFKGVQRDLERLTAEFEVFCFVQLPEFSSILEQCTSGCGLWTTTVSVTEEPAAITGAQESLLICLPGGSTSVSGEGEL